MLLSSFLVGPREAFDGGRTFGARRCFAGNCHFKAETKVSVAAITLNPLGGAFTPRIPDKCLGFGTVRRIAPSEQSAVRNRAWRKHRRNLAQTPPRICGV